MRFIQLAPDPAGYLSPVVELTRFELVTPCGPGPAYIAGGHAIAASIQAGDYTQRLPPERDLAPPVPRRVPDAPSRHAARGGLIVSRQGRATFVAAAGP